jgi:hypothetical protein
VDYSFISYKSGGLSDARQQDLIVQSLLPSRNQVAANIFAIQDYSLNLLFLINAFSPAFFDVKPGAKSRKELAF